jgi:hypothetical protein
MTLKKDTMKDNIEKMHEREGKLEDLESRATGLSEQVVTLLIKVLRLESKFGKENLQFPR